MRLHSISSAVRFTIGAILVASLLAVGCGDDDDEDTAGSGAPVPAFTGPTPTPRLAPTALPAPLETVGLLTGGSGRSNITVMTAADGTLVTFSISGSRTALEGVARDDIKDGLVVVVTGSLGEEAQALTSFGAATAGTLTGGSGRSSVTVMTADGTLVVFGISGSRTTLTGVERDAIADGLNVWVTGPADGEATSLTVVP